MENNIILNGVIPIFYRCRQTNMLLSEPALDLTAESQRKVNQKYILNL